MVLFLHQVHAPGFVGPAPGPGPGVGRTGRANRRGRQAGGGGVGRAEKEDTFCLGVLRDPWQVLVSSAAVSDSICEATLGQDRLNMVCKVWDIHGRSFQTYAHMLIFLTWKDVAMLPTIRLIKLVVKHPPGAPAFRAARALPGFDPNPKSLAASRITRHLQISLPYLFLFVLSWFSA